MKTFGNMSEKTVKIQYDNNNSFFKFDLFIWSCLRFRMTTMENYLSIERNGYSFTLKKGNKG
jgi:hypothetical protein